MNCRTRRTLDFRTHIAPLGLSQRYACLRVGIKLKHTKARTSRDKHTCCCYTFVEHEMFSVIDKSAFCLPVLYGIKAAISGNTTRCCCAFSPRVTSQRDVDAHTCTVDPLKNKTRMSCLTHMTHTTLFCRPQIRRDYPLNLSI